MITYMSSDRRFIVTILAGGEGKRMRTTVPKVLCHFRGKPMIIRILKEVLGLQPDKIFIVVGKYKDQIKYTIESEIYNENTIEYIDQPNPQGTGDAIRCCLPYYLETDRIMILNGDMPCIKHSFLERVLMQTSINSCIIVTARVDDPYGYGRIECNNDDEFRRIIEETDCSLEQKKINRINTGIYVIRGSILISNIPAIKDIQNVKKEYYLTDVFAEHKKYSNIPIHLYEISQNNNWMIQGVNTPEELEKAEKGI